MNMKFIFIHLWGILIPTFSDPLFLFWDENTGSKGPNLNDILNRQEEIRKVTSCQSAKFNNLYLSYTQTYFSSGRTLKCRVFINPEGLLAESDYWIFAVSKTQAFALGKNKGNYALLGVETLNPNENNSNKIATVAKQIGGNVGDLLPFEASGWLAQIPPTTKWRISDLTDVRSKAITDIREESGNQIKLDYKIPRPAGVEIVGQGRAVDAEGTLVLDKSLGYAVVSHEMRIISSRARSIVKETIQYHFPLTEVTLPFIKTYERTRTSDDKQKSDKTRVEYGEFGTEQLKPERLTLDFYKITVPQKVSRNFWAIGLAVFGGILLTFYFLYRKYYLFS
jgi:hypothetical protein